MTQCGLLAECSVGDGQPPKYLPVPLTGVAVDVRIIDLIAQVTVTQNYVNRETQPIEAVYLFPIDEGAGVCEFTAEVDGRLIVGKVKTKEQAQTDYTEAIQSGHSAFLLEEKLPDVFKAKVGNLAPGSGARIRISYVTELRVEPDGDIRFFLPTTIAPRYIPASDNSSVASDLKNVDYTQESHYKVEFKATVSTGSAITDIRSPTHKIIVKIHGECGNKTALVQLEEIIARMDRDLVLNIQVDEPNKPRLIHQKSESGSGAVMLSLVPSFKLADQKTELIFVIDRSGSMMGPGIQQAKQALKLFLHSLPVDCYMNIVGFGFTYQSLFPESRKYDGESLAEAKAHVESLDANMGGTEIYQPLSWVLKLPSIEGYLRQIFILTDGEVSNADQVISLIREESGRSRVFALGLGSSASHHLVEGMARAGNGTALFASLEERLEKKVLQQLQDALQPSLTDVKVKWEGYDEKDLEEQAPKAPVQTEKTLMGYGKPVDQDETAQPEKQPAKFRQAPANSAIPPVFDGRHTVVYALLKENAHVPQWAEIAAQSPDGPLSLRVDLDTNNLETGQLVERLAAKKLIQLLQDKIVGSGGVNEGVKNEIVSLACEYGLASRYTSYIAVDTAENKVLKESWMLMKTRDVPLEVAHGYGGLMNAMAFGAPVPMMNAMPFGAPPVAMMCRAMPPPVMQLQSQPDMAPPVMGRPGMKRCLKAAAPAASDSCLRPENLSMSFSRGAPQESDDFVEADDCIDSDSVSMPCSGNVNEENDSVSPDNEDDKVLKVVSVQNFDGSFQFAPILASLLKSTIEELKTRGQALSADEDVWATCLALVYLNLVLGGLKDSWLLVANKAEKWLLSKTLPNVAELRGQAEKFVQQKLGI